MRNVIGNGDYGRVLDKLEEIRQIAGGEIDLPQICVIGDQSSGKSSLLSTLIGKHGLLPEGSGIVTKCPIVVQLRKGDQRQYQVTVGQSDTDSSDSNNIESKSIKAVIEKRVESDEKPISEKERGRITFQDIKQACSAIKDQQIRILSREGKKVSTTPVFVTLIAPDVPNLVIVDLPGIIHNGEGAEEVEDVIQKYIRPKETLILVARAADADKETQKALAHARKVDPEQQRTKEILTKCDVFSSDENRERILKLLLDGSSGSDPLAPHGVCCRLGGKDFLNEQKETDMFEEKFEGNASKIAKVTGVVKLRSLLETLLAERVETNIPALILSMNVQRSVAENTLKAIGERSKDAGELVSRLCRNLAALTNFLKHSITTLLQKFKDEIRATKACITEDWIDETFKPNAFNPPFFQGLDTFDECILSIRDLWMPLLSTLLDGIRDVLGSDRMLLENDSDIPSTLKNEYIGLWEHQRKALLERLRDATNLDLQQEGHFGTMNHYLTSKFQENLTMPEKLITSFFEAWTEKHLLQWGREGDAKQVLRDLLKSKVEEHFQDFRHSDLIEQTKYRVFCAVQSHWSVEHKTFVDLVLKKVGDVVIRGWKEWVDQISNEKEIHANAKEEKRIIRKRQSALETVEKMSTCLAKIRTIKSFAQTQK